MIELIISTILLLNPIVPAVTATEYFDFDYQTAGPQKINEENLGVELTTSNFLIQDIKSDKILYGKNYDQQTPIASITKLMTALVFIETNPDWQAEVKMEQADETNGAYPHIYRGEVATVRDLFNTMLVSSDNNSAKALVRVSSLSEQQFIKKMNGLAQKYGLKKTSFNDVTGLSNKNASTAQEISQLLLIALENKKISEALRMPAYNFPIRNSEKNRKVYATNILLESFLNSEKHGYRIIGGKTGYLPAAGGCLTVVIEKDGNKVVATVLDSQNRNTRFQDLKSLVDWAFSNYKWD